MSHIDDVESVEIETTVLDLVPESIARESSVLPIALDGDALHVLLPSDRLTDGTLGKLRFVLNRELVVSTASKSQIDAAINHHYSSRLDGNWDRGGDVDPDLPNALTEIDPNTEYAILDLVGQVANSTPACVTLDLGRKCDFLESESGYRRYVGEGRVFKVLGWLDAHYPCRGFHKLFIRCSLPRSYVSFESMRDLVRCMTGILALPSHVSYKIHLEASGHATCMEHPQQGFVCTSNREAPQGDA